MSIYGGKTENLNPNEMEGVLNFFLYRMNMDTRRALMAEMPLHYKKLFPKVGPASIIMQVEEAIREIS